MKKSTRGVRVTAAVILFLLAGSTYAFGLSFASYQKWLSANHTVSFRNHGCDALSHFLTYAKKAGGGVIPIGSNRFCIIWLPQNWDRLHRKRIVISLHGSGGCAERMFNFWYRNRSLHNFGIIALQYGETDARGFRYFDSSPMIYHNLLNVIDRLGKHLSLEDTLFVLHGFSRGSARVFEISVLDRAPGGRRVFSAFIADSGTVFKEYRGRLSPLLVDYCRHSSCYNGARFWAYCGGRDHHGRTCRGLRRMCLFVKEHGGRIDAFFRFPPGGHGIFITGGPRRPSPALNALFAYIENLNQ